MPWGPSYAQPQQPQPPQQGAGNPFLNYLQSPGGASTISAVMGGLGQMAQSKQNERMFNQQQGLSQQQQAAMLQMQAAQAQMNNNNVQNQLGANASPLGWAQQYEQQQALKSIMLDKLLNYKTPPPVNAAVQAKLDASGWKPYTPTMPEEWKNANPFGLDQTLNALQYQQGNIQNLSGGKGPSINFENLGANADQAAKYNAQVGGYQQNAAKYNQNINDQLMQAVNMSRNPAAQGGAGSPAVQPQIPNGYEVDSKTGELKKKGSVWGKIGKIAAIGGAGLATAFTGGAASPLLGAAIGMGSGAALGAMNGGGWKGAALGAAGGAIPGVGGVLAGKIANPILSQVANQGINMAGQKAIGSMGTPGFNPNAALLNGPGFAPNYTMNQNIGSMGGPNYTGSGGQNMFYQQPQNFGLSSYQMNPYIQQTNNSPNALQIPNSQNYRGY